MADGAPRTRQDGTWIRRWGFWLGVIALALAIAAIVFPFERESPRETPRATAKLPEKGELPANPPLALPSDPPEPSASAMVAPAIDTGAPHLPPRKDLPCKPAPIRGCAPNKDDAGCYHCTRCWRPLHYDLAAGSKSITFTCADMLEAPLYVELVGKTPQDASALHWSVSASFERHRAEQPVTPNLGGVFFPSFRGGDVEVTATLQSCGEGNACAGDVEITVNARGGDAR